MKSKRLRCDFYCFPLQAALHLELWMQQEKERFQQQLEKKKAHVLKVWPGECVLPACLRFLPFFLCMGVCVCVHWDVRIGAGCLHA